MNVGKHTLISTISLFFSCAIRLWCIRCRFLSFRNFSSISARQLPSRSPQKDQAHYNLQDSTTDAQQQPPRRFTYILREDLASPTQILGNKYRELLNPPRLLLMPPHIWFGILCAMPASIDSSHGVFYTTDPVTIWIGGNCVNTYKEVWNLQGSQTQRTYFAPKDMCLYLSLDRLVHKLQNRDYIGCLMPK